MARVSTARWNLKEAGGTRKLGIPTVVDRVIQQAIAQQLQPLFEPLFSEGSYGYRPGRSAQQAIRKVKEYAQEGCGYAVEIDLSKYFDTLNHELLMNLLRKQIGVKRVTDLIKKYLKSGVMENGVHCKTEKGSPQGGPLSPLLANIYLNEFDKEMNGRGVNVIRYADDIVVLAKSKRAAVRLLESCRKYLESKLRLQMNTQKSKVVSVVARKHFKFLGFALGKNRNGVSSSWAVPRKSKEEVEGTNEPKSGQECPSSHGESESLHPRMDWLLLCS